MLVRENLKDIANSMSDSIGIVKVYCVLGWVEKIFFENFALALVGKVAILLSNTEMKNKRQNQSRLGPPTLRSKVKMT